MPRSAHSNLRAQRYICHTFETVPQGVHKTLRQQVPMTLYNNPFQVPTEGAVLPDAKQVSVCLMLISVIPLIDRKPLDMCDDTKWYLTLIHISRKG